MAEGLGTLAALNRQGLPERPYNWQVKKPITFGFVPRHVKGRGNVPTIILICASSFPFLVLHLQDAREGRKEKSKDEGIVFLLPFIINN